MNNKTKALMGRSLACLRKRKKSKGASEQGAVSWVV